ncbi:uncharacterized protein LOC127131704 [Lathyrus oleraceus]|uniref:uncharacterized protein LOC127131704 n=1 Tax=Pisum sativum TaxID=3888 RepID=UPI0021D19B5A|nr:uncharacterized protein LOC127131704 [Pisum sativum]
MRKKSYPYCSFQYPSFYYSSSDDKHTPNNHNDNAEKQKHACHVCSKHFSSNKALNGHMRIHKKDKKDIPHDEDQFQCQLSSAEYIPEKSHNCRKRKNAINTIENDRCDKKRLKLCENMTNEKIKEQPVTSSTGHVSNVDETTKIKVKDN